MGGFKMNSGAAISISSLFMASSLVVVSLLFSYFQKLGLEKETLISVGRAIIQLIIVGYILEYVFGQHSPVFTTLLLVFMTFNAAYNAAKRGKRIRNGLLISFVSIALGAIITLSVLLLSGYLLSDYGYFYDALDHGNCFFYGLLFSLSNFL
jgi:putative ABC transport system permease protein